MKDENENSSPDIDDVGRRISDAKKAHENKDRKQHNSASRLSVELLSGVLVGLAFGYFLDKWLDTKPIFFIIFFFLGVAGGVLNIYKLFRNSVDEDSSNAVDENNDK